MLKKSILVWLSIMPLAILNGGFRDYVLTPLMGEGASRPLSGLLLCLLIFGVCLLFLPRLPKGTAIDYLKMGALWLLLTVGFEFSMGYFAMNKNLCELLNAYNPASGDLWLLVVIFIGIAPWFTAKLKHLIVV